ncbi:hypothetical protein PR048_015103 [Dryococelus australis]|uniref:Uncharacterized protein n=1 Tax=Dryococelus australis TaxID=614101 RepID=A0ABQ9HG20_9NEOP|nr:hypothetical protein PR048_015103 [Dryococelus australis]
MEQISVQLVNYQLSHVTLFWETCRMFSIIGYQEDICETFKKHTPLPSSHKQAKEITFSIAKMICTDFVPFSFVESEGFSKLIKYLEPRYSIPQRTKFSKETIPGLQNGYHSAIPTIQHKTFVISSKQASNIGKSDNAANMIRAGDLFQDSSIGCVAHTLQLVLKDSVLNDKSVSNVCGKVRSVVCHFKHSSANKLLTDF